MGLKSDYLGTMALPCSQIRSLLLFSFSYYHRNFTVYGLESGSAAGASLFLYGGGGPQLPRVPLLRHDAGPHRLHGRRLFPHLPGHSQTGRTRGVAKKERFRPRLQVDIGLIWFRNLPRRIGNHTATSQSSVSQSFFALYVKFELSGTHLCLDLLNPCHLDHFGLFCIFVLLVFAFLPSEMTSRSLTVAQDYALSNQLLKWNSPQVHFSCSDCCFFRKTRFCGFFFFSCKTDFFLAKKNTCFFHWAASDKFSLCSCFQFVKYLIIQEPWVDAKLYFSKCWTPTRLCFMVNSVDKQSAALRPQNPDDIWTIQSVWNQAEMTWSFDAVNRRWFSPWGRLRLQLFENHQLL